MFERLRLWMSKHSGLREANRDAAREATREGLLEGHRLGIDDFIEIVSGKRAIDITPKAIETNGHKEPERQPLSLSEIRGLLKADLIELAQGRGIEADDTWTVKQLQKELVK